MPRSWKPEVKVGGGWVGNGLRFPTRTEALANACDLQARWKLVEDARAAESEDEPNYVWKDGALVRLVPWEGARAT